MHAPPLAAKFCQVAWVVKDISAAERFFIETMGVSKFLHLENIAAKDTEGTYLGRAGDWVIHLYLGYAGDTQIELIQPVSGSSIFEDCLQRHGVAVQHIAYWLDDEEYDDAARQLESAGYPLMQSFTTPLARAGYFDTRAAIGVVTELVGATEQGHLFLQDLKRGNF